MFDFKPGGIYCAAGNFYIDPTRKVKRAVITHAHADHCRAGHGEYHCTPTTGALARARYGADLRIIPHDYGESFEIGGVKLSLHPAGHIPGSAQVRAQAGGEVWIVTGDYKLEADGFSEAYEQLRGDVFVTESTFGMPAYRWRPQEDVFTEIADFWQTNKEAGRVTVLLGYSLGKAQRIIHGLGSLVGLELDPAQNSHLNRKHKSNEAIGPIYTHGAVAKMNSVLEEQGFELPETTKLDKHLFNHIDLKQLAKEGALVVAPPAVVGSRWLKTLGPSRIAQVSGWMSIRGQRRWQSLDAGFAVSDHADWPGLNQAVRDSGADQIYVTHGYSEIFSRWLSEQGLAAVPLKINREGEGNIGTESEDG